MQPVYEGFFEEGVKTEGMMTYSSGDKFIGTFDKKGMKKNGFIEPEKNSPKHLERLVCLSMKTLAEMMFPKGLKV